jgi:hypothetical protein
MIEQTALEVTEWQYHEFPRPIGDEEHIPCFISLDVQKKRNAQKKGIACKYSCRFIFENTTILEYTGVDSYVIDFEDVIDKNELLRMIRNSFEKYKEKFEFRKLSTILKNRSLSPLNESMINLDAILPLLI